MKKLIFPIIWAFIIVVAFATLLKVTPLAYVFKTPALTSYFVLRSLGLIVFGFLFIQVILGAFMDKWQKRIGDWVFNIHVGEGIAAYTLIFLHPIAYLLFLRFTGGKFDPYVAFVNVCLICRNPFNYFLTIGRIAFWLVTITVGAAIFRKYNAWMKQNWRKFHVLNYLVFLMIGLHGFLLGSDFRRMPFLAFAIIAYLIVLGIVIFIELPRFYKNFKLWVNS